MDFARAATSRMRAARASAPAAAAASSASSPGAAPLILCLCAVAVCACVVAVFVLDVPAAIQNADAVAEEWKYEYPVLLASVTLSVFIAGVLAFLPTTIAELALGFVFGFSEGYAIAYVGKIIGATACFFLGRSVLRAWLLERFAQNRVLVAVGGAVNRQPYRTACLLRIAYIPFPLKNYGVAMTGMAPLPFFAALLPVELLDTYVQVSIGSSAKDLQSLFSGEYTPEQEDTIRLQLMAVGAEVVVLALALAYLARLAHKLMHDEESSSPALLL